MKYTLSKNFQWNQFCFIILIMILIHGASLTCANASSKQRIHTNEIRRLENYKIRGLQIQNTTENDNDDNNSIEGDDDFSQEMEAFGIVLLLIAISLILIAASFACRMIYRTRFNDQTAIEEPLPLNQRERRNPYPVSTVTVLPGQIFMQPYYHVSPPAQIHMANIIHKDQKEKPLRPETPPPPYPGFETDTSI